MIISLINAAIAIYSVVIALMYVTKNQKWLQQPFYEKFFCVAALLTVLIGHGLCLYKVIWFGYQTQMHSHFIISGISAVFIWFSWFHRVDPDAIDYKKGYEAQKSLYNQLEQSFKNLNVDSNKEINYWKNLRKESIAKAIKLESELAFNKNVIKEFEAENSYLKIKNKELEKGLQIRNGSDEVKKKRFYETPKLTKINVEVPTGNKP